MPLDLSAKRVRPVLRRAPPWAVEARSAWDSLTAGGDQAWVSLCDLEYFLWYILPTKFLNSVKVHRRVALGLSELLDALGYRDAAALARGPVTMRVLDEWNADWDRGSRAMIQALDASGVQPPDTELLVWGGIRGPVEAAAFDLASVALEQAISEHRLTPGTQGWRRSQTEAMERFLTTPSHLFHERTPQQAVWEERQDRWASPPGSPLRQALLEAVREKVRLPPAPPADLPDHLVTLRRLLEVAESGPHLTQAGYLPPSIVRTLASEFGWHRWGSAPRTEADVPELVALRNFAKRARLLRAAAGRLALTTIGRRVATDPIRLWECVVGALVTGNGFLDTFRELLLAQLLSGRRQHVLIIEKSVPVLAEAGWRASGGQPPTREMLSFSLWDAVRPMDVLGIIEAGEWPDSTLALTDFGTVTAHAVLWRRSTSPEK